MTSGRLAPFRAVLFDVGGPIDTEVEHERLTDLHIREALAGLGYPVSEERLAAANRCAIESFAPSAYAAIVWRLCRGDADLAAAAYARLAARSAERSHLRGGLELRPGIDTLIRRLHASGFLLGLAANQPARAVDDLDRFGIGQCFDHREVTAHHGYRKPDVRLFLRACADLGVEPTETVMIGDRIDNDIAPAKWLGMQAVLFRTGRHIDQQPRSWDESPDATVWSVTELEAVLLGGE